VDERITDAQRPGPVLGQQVVHLVASISPAPTIVTGVLHAEKGARPRRHGQIHASISLLFRRGLN
jgi:hypothetical protein